MELQVKLPAFRLVEPILGFPALFFFQFHLTHPFMSLEAGLSGPEITQANVRREPV